jgi:Glycosyl transferases group 1/Glycosyl transferase 4-like domain
VTHWHIITGEYPPQPGGVSDYTRRVARGLVEAGDRVDVWAPRLSDRGSAPDPGSVARGGPYAPLRFLAGALCAPSCPQHTDDGITVHRLPDRFGPRSLRMLSRELDRHPTPRRLLVQYVPHAFGWRAANVPFCLWLQSRRRDSIWVMFHEVAFPFSRNQAVARNALAVVNTLMASIAASSAERAFVSIPGWRETVQSMIGADKPVEWLPVPSSIPVVGDQAASAAVRAQYGGTCPIVGHFGTNGRAIREMLIAAIPQLLDATDCRVLLIGSRSEEVQRELIERHPRLDGRIHGTGTLPDDAVSAHVAACDLMLQPYPDGVSSRRTSAMVALSHGVPIVTTSGWLTEPLWAESGAVQLVPAGEPGALAAAAARLLTSTAGREELGARARELYLSRFDMPHTIRALQAANAELRHLAAVQASATADS